MFRYPLFVVLFVLLISSMGCSGGGEVAEVDAIADQADEPATPAPPPPPPWIERQVTVKRGSTIARILQDQGLEYAEALAVVDAASAIHDLSKIKIGEQLTMRVDRHDESFHGIVYPLDRYGE